MKKGISLIVLVITIIVMIILAAAIIISISNSNVINRANQAVQDTNFNILKEAVSLINSDIKLAKAEGKNPLEEGQLLSDYIEQKLIQDNMIKENELISVSDEGEFLGVSKKVYRKFNK